MPETGPKINPEEFDEEKDHEKGDFSDVHNPEFQNELREAGGEGKEFKLTPEIEEKVMEKVIDLDSMDFYTHNLGGSLHQVLKQGLISPSLERRAKKKGIKIEYPEKGWPRAWHEKDMIFFTKGLVNNRPELSLWTYSNSGVILVIDSKAEIKVSNPPYDNRLIAKRRMKPDRIIGIIASDDKLQKIVQEAAEYELPIYDQNLDLRFPKVMTKYEIKQFVKEREEKEEQSSG